MKNTKKRKGFTLIELVIVVAIIGILALMIIPQFNNVTQDAKDKTFDGNCQTVVSAYAMYQAGNNGDEPSTGSDLDEYINGGFASLEDKPTGAEYDITDGVFTASYDDYGGDKGKDFEYPSSTSGGGTGGTTPPSGEEGH